MNLITVTVPSRTSASLVDSNTFSPGNPGGGNLGFAIDAWTTVKVAQKSQHDRNDTISGDPEAQLLADATLSRWRAFTGTGQFYDIRVMANPLRHVGLASSSALQAAILIALNYFDGTFSTEGELHTYHSQNYLEVAGSKVGNGFTTGLGAFIAQNGGFAMISTDLEPIFVADLPEWPAYVAIPKIRHITTLSSEKNVLLGRARDLDRRDLARKSDIIRGQLIPAVGRSNLKDIGDAIFALQFTGSKLAEIESRPENLIPKMKSLRDQGIECLFMSSLGPAVVLISQLDRTRVIEALESVEFEVAHQGRVVSKVNLIHPAVELQ